MTTLEEKFTALESQLTTQQTEIISALNTIIEALGGAPPTPTVTLGDISTQLTTLIDNMGLIYDANAAFYTSMLSLVGAINDNTDLIITNNSLNAQRILSSILATYCPCSTDAPLLPPVIDITPTTLVDEAKCRRIQFYLSLFGTWLFDVANYGSSGAAITGDVLFALLSAAGSVVGLTATGAEVGSAAGIPGAVVGAVIGLIVGAVYLVGGSQLVNYANDFNSPVVQNALLNALYNATTADEGQTAFYVTTGAYFDAIPSGIINALWWSAWSNDLYSGSPVVDDSAFDGSICVPDVVWPITSGCISFDSVETHLSNGQTLQCIVWPDGGNISPASVSGAAEDLTADQNIFGHADLINLWVSSSPGCHCYYNANGIPNFDIVGVAAQLTTTGNYYTMLNNSSTPFTVTLCVDEPE